MHSTQFLLQLRQLLSERDCQVVISSLRQDLLVWNNLKDPIFAQRALSLNGNKVKNWNPGILALLSVFPECTADTLDSILENPLPPDLRQKAIIYFEQALLSGQQPATLEQAALIALALKERYRLRGTWQGIREELSIKSQEIPHATYRIWATAILCTFNLLSEPIEFLRALIPFRTSEISIDFIALCVHAILCSPFSIEEQTIEFLHLLNDFPIEIQLHTLVQLEARGRSELVQRFAQSLLNAGRRGNYFLTTQPIHSDQDIVNQQDTLNSIDPLIVDESFKTIENLRNFSALYQYAGDTENAAKMLDQANDGIKRYEARLTSQRATLSQINDDFDNSIKNWEKVLDLVPDSQTAHVMVANSMIKADRWEEANNLLNTIIDQPLRKIAQVKIAFHSGDIEHARTIAKTISTNDLIVKTLPETNTDLLSVSNDQTLGEFVNTLLDLGMSYEAVSLTNEVLNKRVIDKEILKSAIKALLQNKSADEAIETSLVAVLTNPDDLEFRKCLATSFEAGQDYQKAFIERQSILEDQVNPKLEDQLAFASTALKIDQPDITVSTAETILHLDPENGFAHSLYGQALLQKKDTLGAIDHFICATTLNPDQTEPWLALSKSQFNIGDHKKSLETLKAAIHAVPNSPKILFALGEACLYAGTPSEALPALREAFTLDNQSPEIAQRLGNTLYDLGHFEEAGQILKIARSSNPDNPELAFLHGQVHLVLGDNNSALKSLLISAKSEIMGSEPAILLAQTARTIKEDKDFHMMVDESQDNADLAVLDDQNSMRIIDALQKALQNEPENFELKLLLGEGYLNASHNQEAFDVFAALTENPKSKDIAWNSRIQLGIGKSAIKTNQVDTAVASLQESAFEYPDSIEIHSALAEALRTASLNQEALIAARETLQMAPDDFYNLIWFTKEATSLNSLPEAIHALEQAIEIAPGRADLILRLAQIHLDNDDTPTAKNYLSRLLEMPCIKLDEYRKAAKILFKIQEFSSEVKFLKLAESNYSDLPSDFYYEMADAYDQNGDTLDALESIQKANTLNPDGLNICFKQADLLSKMNNKLAAISCLEHALVVSEKLKETKNTQEIIQTQKGGLSIPSFETVGQGGIQEAQIHFCLANLLHSNGDLQQAMEHAKIAYTLNPEDIKIRSLATELSYGLMDDDQAYTLCNWEKLLSQNPEPEKTIAFSDIGPSVTLLSILHELALKKQDTDLASKAINQGLCLMPDSPNLLAIQAQIYYKEGNIEEAYQKLKNAKERSAALEKDALVDESIHHNEKPQVDVWTTLSLAEASLKLGEWETAFSKFKQATLLEPQQPRCHLSFARAIVIAAETQEICQALRITKHNPGEIISRSELNGLFENEITTASNLCSTPEVLHLKLRGKAVFQPDINSLNDLSQNVNTPEDIPDLVIGYQKINQIEEASKSAQMASQDPTVKFKLALALRNTDPNSSKSLMNSLIGENPRNPIYNALMAMITADKPLESKEWIEKALNYWPEEIEWHKFAADLGKRIGDPSCELDHWQKIVQLDPNNTSYKISLGEKLIKCDKLNQAIQVLDNASHQKPENNEIWKQLAYAYLKNRNYVEANNSISHVITTDPEDREALLLNGQAAIELNQVDLALQRAETILSTNRFDSDGLVLYARGMRRKGRAKEALLSIEKALPSIINPLPLLLEKTYLIKQTEGNQAALPHIRELAKSDPDNLEVITLLANTYSELGQIEAAEQVAQTALQLAPEDPSMHLLLGHIQRTKGQLDQSIHHLDEVIRQSPAQIEAYLELGRTYQERRDHHRALKIYRQATQIAPEDFRPFYQAGLVLRESKDFVGAESMFRRAARLAPENVNVRRQLGAIITLNLVHNPQLVTIGHEY